MSNISNLVAKNWVIATCSMISAKNFPHQRVEYFIAGATQNKGKKNNGGRIVETI
jgi:hypothetical protein